MPDAGAALVAGGAAVVRAATEGAARALGLPGLQLVGINNRDLGTFAVTLDTTAELRPLVPAGMRVVSESGILTADDVTRLGALGVDAVLVGEGIITAQDARAKVRELSGVRVA